MENEIKVNAQEYYGLKRERLELKNEIIALRNALEGNYPSNVWWMMSKIDRQRIALDALQKKGKGHTKEEREDLAKVVG